jgi:tetratricopeptide (TPR) repeat protein
MMVSRFCFTVTSIGVFALCCAAQAQSGIPVISETAGFRAPASGTGQLTTPVTSQPTGKIITPEMRGDIYMARKMFRDAADAYKEGPTDSAVILNKTGIAYHQMLDMDTAKKYYERAVKVRPEYAEAVNNLGTVYYAKKSYRRAVNYYKRALRYSPNSASIYSNLGTGYFARKNYKDAAVAFEHALQLDPEVFEHKNSQGVLLQERSVEERAKFHYYLAKTYAKAGLKDLAILYVRKSLEEGFKERKKFQDDPEFAILKDLPEFQQLIAAEPRVL